MHVAFVYNTLVEFYLIITNELLKNFETRIVNFEIFVCET